MTGGQSTDTVTASQHHKHKLPEPESEVFPPSQGAALKLSFAGDASQVGREKILILSETFSDV